MSPTSFTFSCACSAYDGGLSANINQKSRRVMCLWLKFNLTRFTRETQSSLHKNRCTKQRRVRRQKTVFMCRVHIYEFHPVHQESLTLNASRVKKDGVKIRKILTNIECEEKKEAKACHMRQRKYEDKGETYVPTITWQRPSHIYVNIRCRERPALFVAFCEAHF